MTAARFDCRHCPAQFTNGAKLGGHVHSTHPEHKRKPPKWLQAGPPRPARPSFKRVTDCWPARA